MDPNLFHLDWERTLEAIVGIVVLSFVVERIAALIFESRGFVRNTKAPDRDSDEGKREELGVATALAIIAVKADPAKVHAIAAAMTVDNPLWPPTADSEKMVQRAEAYLSHLDELQRRRQRLSRWPIKEVGAVLLAAAICGAWQFDAVSIIFLSVKTSWWGVLLTGAVVAGGSKASIKLFQDLLGVKSQALREARGDAT